MDVIYQFEDIGADVANVTIRGSAVLYVEEGGISIDALTVGSPLLLKKVFCVYVLGMTYFIWKRSDKEFHLLYP